MYLNRRHFLASLTAFGGASILTTEQTGAAGPAAKPLPVSCNAYTWSTFYDREKKQWMADPDASLTDYVKSGLTSYEPSFNKADEVMKLAPFLAKYQLSMPSLYVNSTLHRINDAQKSIDSVLAIADAAKPLGTRIIVTNPDPIRWGSDEDKTDADLAEQARNLDRLGAELRKRNITLAYHTHAPEHRQAAREFHHMLLASDPKNVSLCLDAHWVYRGSGNSQLALFDVVRLYGKRIVEVHIRQSKDGIWQESFSEGDIDYKRLTGALINQNVRPLLVLEQCLEKGSPNTMGPVEAQKQNIKYAEKVFTGLI
ncbi:sugar phosphate isomerase/epimerase family protein [Spirosoma utsteinense]|uniref:Inosose dehydratase n=1 Tax=Spirosoma utsteinense TaxID=2585773 RepID=A0ABR6W8U5_9BACT|nr:sugar phosphate isomerase/epimerase [Spirosoma utsteinense]MBC3783949.1 inosose dehydratase [Spirosoma utsteinense]MBC3792583.1 inosose dehydratase [Spirosoma utsteinense]